VLLECRGRVRVGDELLALAPLSALYLEADRVRQVFNDTDADAFAAGRGCATRGGEHARDDIRSAGARVCERPQKR
jgi:hypothetical protein